MVQASHWLTVLAGEPSTPLESAVGSSALSLRKRVQFDGLQVELFQDIDDPVAAAEGENVMSQMRSAELQLAADLEGGHAESFEQGSFERDAVNVAAQDEFESSSIEGDNNRCGMTKCSIACLFCFFLHCL